MSSRTFAILFWLIVGNVSNVFGQSENPDVGSGGFLGGMEMELSGEIPLGNILSYFDFRLMPHEREALQKWLPLTVIDEYLTPESLEALPESVRNKLTEGLRIGVEVKRLEIVGADGKNPARNVPQIISGAPDIPPTSHGIVLDSKLVPPATSQVGLLLPSNVQNQPGGGRRARPEALRSTESGVIVLGSSSNAEPTIAGISEANRAGREWLKVRDRWRLIPLAERRNLIDTNYLPKEVRALAVKEGLVRPSSLEIKKSVPERVRDLFSRLEFDWDLKVMEFRHLHPLTDLSMVAKDIELFSDLAQIRRFVEDPSKPELDIFGFSLHFHMSKAGSNFKELIERLNVLRLVELGEQGRAEAGLGDYGFNTDVGKKGLLRLYKDSIDRIESRTHVEGPRAAIATMRRWMEQPELSKIEALIDDKLNALEQVVETRGSSRSEKIRSAYLTVARLRPNSPILQRAEFDDLAIDVYHSSQQAQKTISGNVFRTRKPTIDRLADLSVCADLNCIEARLNFASTSIASSSDPARELALFSDAIRKDFPRWTRFKSFSAESVVRDLWSRMPSDFSDTIISLTKPTVEKALNTIRDVDIKDEVTGMLKAEKFIHDFDDLLKACLNFDCVSDKINRAWALLSFINGRRQTPVETSFAQAIAKHSVGWPTLAGYDLERLIRTLRGGREGPVAEAVIDHMLTAAPQALSVERWTNVAAVTSNLSSLTPETIAKLEGKLLGSAPTMAEAERFGVIVQDRKVHDRVLVHAAGKISSPQSLIEAYENLEQAREVGEAVGRSNGKRLQLALDRKFRSMITVAEPNVDVAQLIRVAPNVSSLSKAHRRKILDHVLAKLPSFVPWSRANLRGLQAIADVVTEADIQKILLHPSWRTNRDVARLTAAEFLMATNRIDLLQQVLPHVKPAILNALTETLGSQQVPERYQIRPLLTHAGLTSIVNTYLQGTTLDDKLVADLVRDFAHGPWDPISMYDGQELEKLRENVSRLTESSDGAVANSAQEAKAKMEKTGFWGPTDVSPGGVRVSTGGSAMGSKRDVGGPYRSNESGCPDQFLKLWPRP